MSHLPARAATFALIAILAAACAAPAPEVLLETPRARVTARVLREGDRWCVRDIEGVALGEPDLLGLHVRMFLDANGNGAVEDGEERGGWHTSSTVPSRRLYVSGALSWAPLEDSRPELWKLETRVQHDGEAGGEDRDVRAAFSPPR